MFSIYNLHNLIHSLIIGKQLLFLANFSSEISNKVGIFYVLSDLQAENLN